MEPRSKIFVITAVRHNCGRYNFQVRFTVSGIGSLGGSHMNVMLGVRDITNTSAVLDWMVPDDKPIVGFKVSWGSDHEF